MNTFISSKEKTCEACEKPFIARFARSRFCDKRCQGRLATARYWKRRESLDFHLKSLLRRGKSVDRSGLSYEFLLKLYERQRGRCAISNVEMTWVTRRGRVQTNLSIDRIDQNIGYLPTNVHLVCDVVNMMRRSLSLLEFKEWCSLIVRGFEMPSRSQAQHRMMEAIAHGAKPKSGKGPSKAVAQEFVAADKGKSVSKLPKHVPPKRGKK